MAIRSVPVISAGVIGAGPFLAGIVAGSASELDELLEGTGFRAIGACFMYEGIEDATEIGRVCKGFEPWTFECAESVIESREETLETLETRLSGAVMFGSNQLLPSILKQRIERERYVSE